jgi:hypothetical protein
MGTSGSSDGPGPNVPLVPPWVPPLPTAPTAPVNPTPPTVPLAPPARFGTTRLNLGKFASTGDRDYLSKGVGNYFKTGYGGGGTASGRFGGTAQSAGSLFGALSGGGGAGVARTPERDALEEAVRNGAGTDEVIGALIEAVRPVDGTQDAEAGRRALADTLSELMTRHPTADPLNLTPAQINLSMALFIANDVYARFFLDVGKSIIEHAPSVTTGLARLKEVKEYIREVVVAQFNKLTATGIPTTKSRMVEVVSSVLKDAVDVFEEYAS